METVKFIIFHDSIHLALSILIGAILVRIYKNSIVFIASVLSGILLDLDHLFDLVLAYLKTVGPIIEIETFIGLFFSHYMADAGKVYVLFHSLDFIWVWWIIGNRLNKTFKTQGLQWALPLSVFVHILVDYASYMPHPLAYIVLFRLWHNFSLAGYKII